MYKKLYETAGHTENGATAMSAALDRGYHPLCLGTIAIVLYCTATDTDYELWRLFLKCLNDSENKDL